MGSNKKEFSNNLNSHSISKISLCVPQTPKDDTKGRNVTEKNKTNNLLNENQNMEYTLSTQNKPHTNLSSLTKTTTQTLHNENSTLDIKNKVDHNLRPLRTKLINKYIQPPSLLYNNSDKKNEPTKPGTTG